MMLIGIDFDNTIVCYDKVFHKAAVEQGLIHEGVSTNKGSIRDFLRAGGKEDQWTRLQGIVYGDYIKHVPPFPGVVDFFKSCKAAGIRISIISHKTKHPFLGDKHDLHAAAKRWLEDNGFHGEEFGVSKADAFFELTKQDKLKRIKDEGCTDFIDDLPEFLLEEKFPIRTKRHLFDPNDLWLNDGRYKKYGSWGDIGKELL
jgi:hypothetical protein